MILIDLKKTTDNIREKFNNKDLVSLDDLLDEFDSLLEESKKETEKNQIAVDYIASMTDSYAIEKYKDIFIPKPLAMPQRDENLIKLANMI